MGTVPSCLLAGLFAAAPIVAGAAMPPYPPPVDAEDIGSSFEELDRVPWEGLPQMVQDGQYWVLPKDAPPFPLSFALSATLA